MPQDRMMQAIGRIERSLARLEMVSTVKPRAETENLNFQRRYERLRHETEAAIGEIDALLNQRNS